MVFRAQVLDNSDFARTGKIRVRIEKQYTEDLTDLSQNPEKILEGLYYSSNSYGITLKHMDIDARIFSPIGGGNDYGMFFLPQVNTSGIVLMIGEAFESSNDYLWLGSIFDMSNGTIKIPSDTMDEKNGVENNTLSNSNVNGALVLKLRSTNLKDQTKPQESKDDMDWTKSPVENLVVLNKEKILLEHSANDSNKKVISNSFITTDSEGVRINFNTGDFTGEMGINSTGGFFLKSFSTSDESGTTIEGSNLGISITCYDNSEKTTNIVQDSASIGISSGKSSINIKEKNIDITSDLEINLNAEKVNLGPTGLRVVLCDADIDSFALSSGVILSTSKTISG